MNPFSIRDRDDDSLHIVPFISPEHLGSDKQIQLFRIVVNDNPDGVDGVDLTVSELKQVRDYIIKLLEIKE